MKQLLLAFCLCVTATACGPRYADYYPYHEDGRVKPSVVMLPIQDKSDSGLKWNLSDELNQNMTYRLLDSGNLYVLQGNVSADTDCFSRDLNFAKQGNKADFVVAMELIEHRTEPYERGKITPLYLIHNRECDSVLLMKMRVRIIDTRSQQPVVVLQEIHQSNHMLPRDRDNIDYSSCHWGMDPYNRTPVALGHQKMMDDISARVERVISGVR